MEHYIVKETPSQINWVFRSIAGEEFSLAGYTYRLYYSAGRGRTLATGVTHVGNTLTWSFTPKEQWKNGHYDLEVEVLHSGNKIITVTYPEAFVLVSSASQYVNYDGDSTAWQDDVSTINIVSSVDINRFVPLAPVIGSDGKWYIDGHVVLDDNDNPVYADSTIDIESDGTITVNKGRHNEYTITSLKTALVTAASDHSTAVSDHNAAVSDHNTAAFDHTAATTDHNTAVSDHNTAAADHTTAASDHTAAAAANALAASDHTTAASDHSTAYADHGTAVTDHNTAAADHSAAAADHSAAGTDRTNAAADRLLAESDHERAEEDHTAVTEALETLGEGFVSTKEAQSFTDSEKAQARANIGAGTYSVPSGGIPSNQMTPDVQSALSKANSAVQPAGIANFITASDLSSALSAKQDKLISGTNIKTINNTSILGSGNITIQGGGGSDPDAVKYTEQSLTSEQKAQARTNIGAGTSSFSGSYNDLSNKPDLSGFITKSVNDLTNYYLKTETYTQTEVNNLIGAISQFHYEIAASRSAVTSPQSNVLYLIGPTGSGSDKYEEYVYPDATTGWVKIGDTSIDLSGYVTTSALNTALADYTTTTDLTTLLGGKADKVTSATSGNFAGFDSNGNLVDSGHKHSDYLTSHQDISGKEDTSNKVSSWSSTTTDTHYPSEKLVKDSLDAKQAALVSGTNIKTINNESLLGPGNIDIQGGGISTLTLTFTPNEGETFFGTKAQAATALGITENEVDSLMAGDYDRLIFNGLYADKSTPGQVTSDAAYQRYVAADYNGVPYSLFLIYEDGGYGCWWKRQVPALSTSIYTDANSNSKSASPKSVKDYIDDLPIPRLLHLGAFTPTESSSYISLGNASAAADALNIEEEELYNLYDGVYNRLVMYDIATAKVRIAHDALHIDEGGGATYEMLAPDGTPYVLDFLYESSAYKYRYYSVVGDIATLLASI